MTRPEDAIDFGCPSEDCYFCNGQACMKCGAGLSARPVGAPRCEHDVIERHESKPLSIDALAWPAAVEPQ